MYAIRSYYATIQAVTAEKDGQKELSVILIDRDTPGYFAEAIHIV